LVEDDTSPHEDRWDVYVPCDRPGVRARHQWLSPGVALSDVLENGFALLNFAAADSETAAFQAAAAARRVPLKIVDAGQSEAAHRARLVLVRPDQHIAWCGNDAGGAAWALDRARGAI
jgi:hypothetical protein